MSRPRAALPSRERGRPGVAPGAGPWVRRGARLGACALALAAWFLSVGAAERSKLDKLNEDIRRHREDLKKAETEVSTSLDSIHDIDRRLEDVDKTLAEISTEVIEASGRLAAVQEDLSASEREYASRQRQLSRHLRLLYKLGRYPMVKVLVGAEDMGQLVRRVRFAVALAREDRRLARAVERRRDEVKRDRDAVARELDYLKSLQQLNLKEMDVSRGRRAQKTNLLLSARKRRDLLTKRLKDLKEEKAELEGILRTRASTSKRPGGTKRAGRGADLLARHGKIAAPTAGSVIRKFGLIVDDRYDTVTQNDGVDIAAPLGANVKAAMKGKVIFADWFRGYGKLLIVDHGGGYTSVYAHLGSFAAAPGEAVGEGQAIGTVGDTGYVSGPTLHFEIRRDGVAVDPEKWLQ